VVCADGGSEDGFGAVYLAQPGYAPVRLQRLDDSLANGRTYGAMAQLLIEDDYLAANLDGGGKLLGLAGYGEPTAEKKELIRQSVAVLNGGPTVQPEVIRRLGGDLDPLVSPHLDTASTRLAASFQQCWTEDILSKLAPWRRLTAHLAITGGCAQNVRANAVLATEAGYSSVLVPFAPTDAGQSIGVVVEAFGVPAPTCPYLGRDFGTRLTGTTVARVVDDLRRNRVVAVHQGHSESGPRALGNRSVLALARDVDTRLRVSEHVKHREAYRPLAPAVRSLDVPRFFHTAPSADSTYMSFAWSVTDEFGRSSPAAVHVDGTSRPQAVSAHTNAALAAILDLLEGEGDFPVVVNTSMNVAGKPMVDSPADALEFFEESGVDVLYVGDRRIAR
jgi:carbamoyltransferase